MFKSKNGSHAKYIKISKGMHKQTAIVPIHSSDVPKGTLKSILKQSDIPLSEFTSNL